jgi:hypothetical protein
MEKRKKTVFKQTLIKTINKLKEFSNKKVKVEESYSFN